MLKLHRRAIHFVAVVGVLIAPLLSGSALSAPSALAAGGPIFSTVTEHRNIAETGVYVTAGHQVTVDATTDQIWSGVWFSGWNGPAGWSPDHTANSQFPMPRARVYSLLASVGGTKFYVGNGTTFTAPTSGYVYLQINDDVPGNGGGDFSAYVSAN